MFPPQYYYPVYIYLILIWSFVQYFECSKKNVSTLLNYMRKSAAITLFAILFIVFVGLRPISWHYFGDTVNYAQTFYAYQNGIMSYDPDSSEWLFNGLMASCAKVMDVQFFFLIIEIGYVGLMLWACRRLISNNVTVAMLFCFGAFSFFTYGVNGIRNGLACSLMLLAFSYINGKTREKVVAGILSFAAYNIHHSTALPILCMVVSLYYRNTKMIYLFWLGSIVISAVASSFVESIFTGLGFDDRLDGYLHNMEDDYMFSHTGFRWDFLLYSAMPMWLGWYVVLKRKIFNSQYLLLLHTYVLANAFWVMLIRASYSNRFAYLSWFMYPVVLAYPLLTLPIWKDQGKKVGMILVGHILFTYLMWIRG